MCLWLVTNLLFDWFFYTIFKREQYIEQHKVLAFILVGISELIDLWVLSPQLTEELFLKMCTFLRLNLVKRASYVNVIYWSILQAT